MHPKEQMNQDLKMAMKAGDVPRREALRLLLAAFKQVEVDQRKELSPEDAQAILVKEAKKRRESIEEMLRAKRDELIKQEQFELDVIEGYLPKQMARADIEALAREAIAEVGATTAKDTGAVMKALMPRVKGQADGKVVGEVVRDLLG